MYLTSNLVKGLKHKQQAKPRQQLFGGKMRLVEFQDLLRQHNTCVGNIRATVRKEDDLIC